MMTKAKPQRSAAEYLPEGRSLDELRQAAASCKGCPLWEKATQTVFGRGSGNAKLLLIGEQPGDQEDLAGEPFVGPAGRLLDEALISAGIERNAVYLTNAVKHFKWVPKGKRRIHQKPSGREISACRPWLKAEVEAVRPHAVVCLGVTAAQAVFGRPMKISTYRGQLLQTEFCDRVTITVHPSSILRIEDHEGRAAAREQFAHDLAHAARV